MKTDTMRRDDGEKVLAKTGTRRKGTGKDGYKVKMATRRRGTRKDGY